MKNRRRAHSALIAATVLVSVFGVSATARAAGAEDTAGREWRQLYETTGLSWNQVAAVCPQDGVTPCSGSAGGRTLSGWVWATDDQVVEFMGDYAPDILTADPPGVSGPDYFGSAIGFLGEMRWTFYASGYGFYIESTSGVTSSRAEDGAPIIGSAGYGWWPPTGSLGVGPAGSVTDTDQYRGVWLWRPAGVDYSAPVITPTVEGEEGTNGWFVSDVTLLWDVVDAESPIDSTTGCDPSSVTSDTTDKTFSCQATSVGGTANASVTVKRDVTAPVVTCSTPAPEIPMGQLGASVTAAVTDATSGPVSSVASTIVNTNSKGSFTAPVTGRDRAGNATTTNCPYEVVVPLCYDLEPTIVGTVGNDTITGTRGRDVIVALSGNDTVDAKEGSDVICGGDNVDTITGGAGRDLADGGAGDDSLYGSGGDDYLTGGDNNDSIRGDAGRDTCSSGEVRMSSCEVIR